MNHLQKKIMKQANILAIAVVFISTAELQRLPEQQTLAVPMIPVSSWTLHRVSPKEDKIYMKQTIYSQNVPQPRFVPNGELNFFKKNQNYKYEVSDEKSIRIVPNIYYHLMHIAQCLMIMLDIHLDNNHVDSNLNLQMKSK